MTAIPDLWIYVCEHSAQQILARGVIQPRVRLLSPMERRALRLAADADRMAAQLCWMSTNGDHLPAGRVPCQPGATCDIAEYRFQVLPGEAVRPWSDVRGGWPRNVAAELEVAHPEGQPKDWWVSGGPIAVVLAPRVIHVNQQV